MYDIIIIGAGPGGYELALEAAKEHLKILLIEEKELGGTCLNEGCIPTKAYYKNASFLKELEKSNIFGVDIAAFQFDFSKIKARKDATVAQLKEGISFLLKKAKVDYVQGTAIFKDQNTISVKDEIYQGKNIVIATGSKPVVLPGFEDALTSTTILELDTLPKKLIIVGGGVIGIEFATIFNKFGVEVEIVEYAPMILSSCDEEIAKRLTAYLKQAGIKIHTSSKAIKKDANYIYIHEKDQEVKLNYDQVLVAVGRKANVFGLGLEHIGLSFTNRGIIVNEHFQTNIEHIYAIGDVIGTHMLAHYATYSGFAVLHHMLSKKHQIDFSLVPSCVFTFPEVAWVGPTENELKSRNINYVVYKSMYRANGKSLAMGEVDGFVKVIVVNGIITACHIIGYDASTLIHEMNLAIKNKMSVEAFHDVIHAHPTLSEIFSTALKSEI